MTSSITLIADDDFSGVKGQQRLEQTTETKTRAKAVSREFTGFEPPSPENFESENISSVEFAVRNKKSKG